MTKKKVTPIPKKVFKYSVEIRVEETGRDEIRLQTNNFREAFALYNSIKDTMDKNLSLWDIVVLYVWAGDSMLNEYVPVIMTVVEMTVTTREF